MAPYKLISPKSFIGLLEQTIPRVVPVDGTWLFPQTGRNARQEFLEVERIPNAVYFDIDVFQDPQSKYPHMFPPLSVFNKEMSALGLRKDDILVVYDRFNNLSASKVACTLSLLGHPVVYLLTGFQQYKDENYPVENTKANSITPYPPSEYTSTEDHTPTEVVTYEEMVRLVDSGDIKNYNVLDARPLPRFLGETPEPRPGVPSGHIPGSQPMPYSNLLTNASFPETAAEMLSNIENSMNQTETKIDPSKPTIVTCGSGVTACAIKTALQHAGLANAKIYDGSWSEWAQRVPYPTHPRISKGKDW